MGERERGSDTQKIVLRPGLVPGAAAARIKPLYMGRLHCPWCADQRWFFCPELFWTACNLSVRKLWIRWVRWGGMLKWCNFWISRCFFRESKAELKSTKRILRSCLGNPGARGGGAADRPQDPLRPFLTYRHIGGGLGVGGQVEEWCSAAVSPGISLLWMLELWGGSG